MMYAAMYVSGVTVGMDQDAPFAVAVGITGKTKLLLPADILMIRRCATIITVSVSV